MKQFKKISIFIIAVMAVICLSACSGVDDEKKVIKIGVMGNPEEFYMSYQDGIEAALMDVKEEYADTGYTFEVEFYDDQSNYETGMKIIDTIVDDESITAVISTVNMDISKSAAHQMNEHKKIFISPYFMYDSVCESNYYDYVFSLCNSAHGTGMLLRQAMADRGVKRVAVCSLNREFENAELQGFVNAEKNSLEVADCVSQEELLINFDNVIHRWELLDVEGVVFFLADNDIGHTLLKMVKAKQPDWICAGDTLFDNSELMETDTEYENAMRNFIMTDEFSLDYTDENDNAKFDEMAKQYEENNNTLIDYWFLQGYNVVRMICDTAVEKKTTDSTVIAKALHDMEEYDGIMQRFAFDSQGAQIINSDYYVFYTSEGIWDKYTVK